MARSVRDRPWSSYRSSAGMEDCPARLESDWILSAFSEKRFEAIERYRKIVAEGKNQPALWEILKNKIFLGTDAFVQKKQSIVPVNNDLSEVPLGQRRAKPKSIEHYLFGSNNRDEAIALAYNSGGYRLKEIGEHFGLHCSRVSRIISQQRGDDTKDKT